MVAPVKRIVRKLRERIPPHISIRPPIAFTIALLTLVSIFLLAGGVYNIMMKPLVLLPRASGFPIFYYYGLHEQTWFESLAAIILLIIGMAGMFVSYKSTRYAYKPRQATTLLLIGVALLLISFVGCEYIIMLKRGI